MTPEDTRLKLLENGYVPLPCAGKEVHLEGWTSREPTDFEVKYWTRARPAETNTGVQTRKTPALDADITNPEAAAAIEALVRERFEDKGHVLSRFGQSPKRAIPFRADQPFPKLKQVFGDPSTPEGDCEKLEFLADGQQFIVDGIHPGTLKPYSWHDRTLLEVKHGELPCIRPEEAKALFDDVVQLLVTQFGYRLRTEHQKAANGAGAEAHQAGADWQLLFDNIRNGHSLHDSLRGLAAKMIKSGTHAGAAVNQLRALMEASAAARDDRWQERFAEIPRLVSSAEAKIAADAREGKERPGALALPVSDFIAFSPDHTYIHRATGETWTATAINARVPPVDGGDKKPLAANVWLDRNDAVEQRVWSPGDLPIIKGKLVSEGGFLAKPGARLFNLYKPPQIITSAAVDIRFWRDRLHALWPEQADHIECWLAHRSQRPGEKINHALVLGGKPGIGKDAVADVLKITVGPWNFAEISPQAVLGTFNEFARSVVLRISEGKDLGDIDRFAFYEATKTLIAAPPDTLRVNPKYVSPYYVMNVTGVIITTNHKVGGLFLPPDDRRHFVAWSTVEPSAFSPDDWMKYWATFNAGGAHAVADHLRRLDLAQFNPKAPPPHTQAFWEMVNAMRSEEESEMADIIESLGSPDALIIVDLIARAHTIGPKYLAFAAFLQERKNSRLVAIQLEQCGYRRLANPNEHAGRWVIEGQRTDVYVRQSLTDREAFQAVRARGGPV